MTRSRAEHLAWCKSRALEILDSGDPAGAVASMSSDLQKWEGGQMYDPTMLAFLGFAGAVFETQTVEGTRRWIEGFN